MSVDETHHLVLLGMSVVLEHQSTSEQPAPDRRHVLGSGAASVAAVLAATGAATAAA